MQKEQFTSFNVRQTSVMEGRPNTFLTFFKISAFAGLAELQGIYLY